MKLVSCLGRVRSNYIWELGTPHYYQQFRWVRANYWVTTILQVLSWSLVWVNVVLLYLEFNSLWRNIGVPSLVAVWLIRLTLILGKRFGHHEYKFNYEYSKIRNTPS